MNKRPIKTKGPSIEGHWNDLTTLERVKMILSNAGHFLSMGLITRQELDRVMATDESEWEYISENHPDVLFQNISIKKEIRAQAHRNELKAALNAAFFESK